MVVAKRSTILNLSIAISFITHAFFLFFLQNHSLWFAPTSATQAQKIMAGRKKNLEKSSADEILKEVFSASGDTAATAQFLPKKEEVFYQFTAPAMPPLEAIEAHCSFPSLPVEERLSIQTFFSPIHTFTLPTVEQFDFFADLPKDLLLPSVAMHIKPSSYVPMAEVTKPELKTQVPERPINEEILSVPVAFATSLPVVQQADEVVKKASPTIPMPSLPHLPSLADLQTVNLSDCFDAELSFLPRSDGPGYVFALTLLPRSDLNLAKLKQNVIFLVDKSNSIQKGRLQATQHAILRAMEELNEDVKFNIIAFDTKMEKLFPSLTSPSAENTAKAQQFLESISLGSLFSVSDLHKALFLTIPSHIEEDELYTAILLTDGESLTKKPLRRSLLRDWTVQNGGKVSLYALGIDGDPNLATLDAACAMNKGKYLSASTNRGLRRKLMKLAKNIRSPIAKNVTTKAVAHHPRAHLQIHLNASQAPHLYLDEPYVILGSTETLDDFILFVQARVNNGWINIKKPIAFAQAKKGGQSLHSQWALQTAYRNYERYIKDENQSHLAEAKKLLEPFNIQAIQ